MKKLVGITAFSLFLGFASFGQAKEVHKAGHAVAKGAKKAGNKTAEVASKGKSKVFNNRVKDRTGPNNEVIYMTNNGTYYWIDKKGKHHAIAEASLKTKV